MNTQATGRWRPEDFLDIAPRDIEEDDPWAIPVTADGQPPAGVPHLTLHQPESRVPAEPLACFQEQPAIITDLAWADEGPTNYIDDLGEWDEPEYFAEPDSDLHEPLYFVDPSITAISRDLTINIFASGIADIDNEQIVSITQLLGEFSIRRLQSWLPWLREQEWTGQSLLLFLEFRKLWESESVSDWWESCYWNSASGCYLSSFSHYALSKNATYQLIQNRLDYPANQVIDDQWFVDWNEGEIWKRGFPTFAVFALLRSECTDWETRLEAVLEENTDVMWRAWKVDAAAKQQVPFYLVEQDWHHSSEWHDNLGWCPVSMGGSIE